MKYRNFHATLNDLTPRLEQIEGRFDLKYIPLGGQKSAAGDVYTSIFVTPNFGVSQSGHFTLNDGFLVCPADKEFVIEVVPQRASGIRYLVESASNPGAFGFYPGGMAEPDRLIGGYIWPNTIEPSVRKLCFAFSRLLLKGFEPVLDADHDPWWVGPEAMQMLQVGDTLVTGTPWPLALPVDKYVDVNGMNVRIRQTLDFEAMRRVLTVAFQRSNEADLVEALHPNGHLHLSLSAEVAGNLVGYAAFSPVNIKNGDRTFYYAEGLGPLAVLPEFQRQGIGSALVHVGLEAMFRRGRHIIVVLGDPAFYGRFGFAQSTRYGIRWEHDAPESLFQVIGRRKDTLDGVSGVVSYMPEFEKV